MTGEKWAVKRDQFSPRCAYPPERKQSGPGCSSQWVRLRWGEKERPLSKTTWWPHSLQMWPNVCQALTSLPSQTSHSSSLGAGQQVEWRKTKCSTQPSREGERKLPPLKVTLRTEEKNPHLDSILKDFRGLPQRSSG